MKRITVLSLVMGMVVLVLAAPALAAPSLSASSGSGPPGTVISVTGADFSPGLECTLHLGALTFPPSNDSGRVGTCSVNGSRVLTGSFTVPDSSVGNFNLWACNGSASTPCGDEFVEKAATPFSITVPPTPPTVTITIPPPTPTVTVPLVTTTTLTTIPGGSGEPCVIPDGATVIDFDAWDRSMGDTLDPFGDLHTAMISAGHPLDFNQWDWYEVNPPPGTQMAFGPSVYDSLGYVTNNPARDLWTTSPPKVMRLIDDTHWTLVTNWGVGYEGGTGPVPNLPAQPDYIGFNVGFGHFGEGFETPENLVVELRVRHMPIHFYPEDVILDQGAWETVSVTLGPGPQPVAHCLMATNTLGGVADAWSVYLIDILPRTIGGAPVHIPVDIDDLFYGNNAPSSLELETPIPSVTEPAPVITTPVTLPNVEQPIGPFENPPTPSHLPWLIAVGLAGLLIGAGAFWGLRRR